MGRFIKRQFNSDYLTATIQQKDNLNKWLFNNRTTWTNDYSTNTTFQLMTTQQDRIQQTTILQIWQLKFNWQYIKYDHSLSLIDTCRIVSEFNCHLLNCRLVELSHFWIDSCLIVTLFRLVTLLNWLAFWIDSLV